METRLPIVILTGFLGSGKTTLLNEFLRHSASADTAVLINEFGEVGIDHLIVDAIEDDIVLLEAGCVCCGIRDDLTASLLELASKRAEGLLPPFKRVVLETTGVADPSTIIQTIAIDRDVARIYCHAGTLSVVDATFAANNFADYREAIDQVAVADRVYLSKTDLATKSEIDLAKTEISKVNPAVDIELPDNRGLGVREMFALSQTRIGSKNNYASWSNKDSLIGDAQTNMSEHHGDHHGHRFSSFVVKFPGKVELEHMVCWLDNLLAARGDSILRIKGFVQTPDRTESVLIQTVQHAVYPPTWIETSRAKIEDNELVFITRGFTKKAAMRSLVPFVEVAPY